MFGVISIGIANVLVLLRVVLLWEDRPVVFKFMSVGFSTGFIAQFVCMIIANIKLGPSISWSPIAKMCIISSSTPLYIAVWVSPMLFEVLVLVSTAVNALDRPRTAQTRIVSALHSDGVAYFFALTILRSLNLAMAATANPSLTLMTVFFVWAMTTTVLNRSLLNFRVSNTKPSSTSPPNPPRRGSPFGTGHLSNSTVKVVDMDDMTLCWDPERHDLDGNGDVDAGRHKPSESIGSSTRLMRLDSRERSRRGLPESDWFPDV
ncbi:hypothetical protein EUX98_g4571 [Antrodiella citrinella]|uniref:Uncharacterized protein n=1 Tax=Antrodiella citrinella TaxID=2447956 RepID=A0A4S4MTT7_9APHY|nr:hypothetical protein EUX98_g4571 [Antrodiella citrinella]